ncbi:hypothetical protein [Photobacterium leiognathi]|uniref:hypothetical protein n=1 Tax=Photobacterium leiognathi TaxID=553611 RepID=UPI0029818EA4|nr:hypothetical protein [Photobacterium leiognathi]
MATYFSEDKIVDLVHADLESKPLHSIGPILSRKARELSGNSQNQVLVATPPNQFSIIYPFLQQIEHSEVTEPAKISQYLNNNRLNHGKNASFTSQKISNIQDHYGKTHNMVGELGYNDPPFIKIVIEQIRNGLTYFSLVHTKDNNETPFWRGTKNIQGDEKAIREQIISSLTKLINYNVKKYPNIPISIITTPEMTKLIGVKHGLFNYIEECLSHHYQILNNNTQPLINNGSSKGRNAKTYRKEIERFLSVNGTLNIKNRDNFNSGKDFSFPINKYAGGLDIVLNAKINKANMIALTASVNVGGRVTNMGRITKYRKSFHGCYSDFHKNFSVNGLYEHIGIVSVENHSDLIKEFTDRVGLDIVIIEPVNDIKPKPNNQNAPTCTSAYIAVKDMSKTQGSQSTSVTGVLSGNRVVLAEDTIANINSLSKKTPQTNQQYDRTLRRILAVNELLNSEGILPLKDECRLYLDDFRTFCLISALNQFCSTTSKSNKNATGEGLHHALNKIFENAQQGGDFDGVGCFIAAIKIVNDKIKKNKIRSKNISFQHPTPESHVFHAIKELHDNLQKFKSLSIHRFKKEIPKDEHLKQLKSAVDDYIKTNFSSKRLERILIDTKETQTHVRLSNQ